ncbi:MAG: hypothetical protein PHY72_00155 [Candidatus Pacebacteria bacterium]|nr:hypothetical protein [Candidatus Paceibacterota bacterium]
MKQVKVVLRDLGTLQFHGFFLRIMQEDILSPDIFKKLKPTKKTGEGTVRARDMATGDILNFPEGEKVFGLFRQ